MNKINVKTEEKRSQIEQDLSRGRYGEFSKQQLETICVLIKGCSSK